MRFKKDDTSLEDKQKSVRTYVVEDEELLEMVEQHSSKCISTLKAELCASQSNINRHLLKLGLVNRRCQKVPVN